MTEHDTVLNRLEEFQVKFARSDEWMSEVTRETDRRSREVCNSIGHFIDEQYDISKTVEDLAPQIEALREVGVPAFLEIEDLKREVVHLTEQVGQNTQAISTLTPLLHRVDLMANQIMRWRYRLPDLTADDDDSDEEATIVTAVEVQEQLGAFKGATRRKIEELRQVPMALEDRVNIFRRSRDDACQ